MDQNDSEVIETTWTTTAEDEQPKEASTASFNLIEISIKDVAMICHEANRAYSRVIGDDSHLPWDDAPEWQKLSALNGVERLMRNRDVSTKDMHQNWVDHKHADGWVYGPVKDEEMKTHPCLLPYDKLPAEQKAKDALFQGIALALIKSFDFSEKKTRVVIQAKEETALIESQNQPPVQTETANQGW